MTTLRNVQDGLVFVPMNPNSSYKGIIVEHGDLNKNRFYFLHGFGVVVSLAK